MSGFVGKMESRVAEKELPQADQQGLHRGKGNNASLKLRKALPESCARNRGNARALLGVIADNIALRCRRRDNRAVPSGNGHREQEQNDDHERTCEMAGAGHGLHGAIGAGGRGRLDPRSNFG